MPRCSAEFISTMKCMMKAMGIHDTFAMDAKTKANAFHQERFSNMPWASYVPPPFRGLAPFKGLEVKLLPASLIDFLLQFPSRNTHINWHKTKGYFQVQWVVPISKRKGKQIFMQHSGGCYKHAEVANLVSIAFDMDFDLTCVDNMYAWLSWMIREQDAAVQVWKLRFDINGNRISPPELDVRKRKLDCTAAEGLGPEIPFALKKRLLTCQKR